MLKKGGENTIEGWECGHGGFRKGFFEAPLTEHLRRSDEEGRVQVQFHEGGSIHEGKELSSSKRSEWIVRGPTTSSGGTPTDKDDSEKKKKNESKKLGKGSPEAGG